MFSGVVALSDPVQATAAEITIINYPPLAPPTRAARFALAPSRLSVQRCPERPVSFVMAVMAAKPPGGSGAPATPRDAGEHMSERLSLTRTKTNALYAADSLKPL